MVRSIFKSTISGGGHGWADPAKRGPSPPPGLLTKNYIYISISISAPPGPGHKTQTGHQCSGEKTLFPSKCVLLCIETFQRSLPAYARVKQSRVPNAYDKTALRLEVINVSQLPQHHFIPPSIVPAGDDDPPLLSSDLILLTTTSIPTTTSINEDQKQNIGRQCLISAHPRLVTLSR